jgi:5'-nucleotidase
MQDEPSILLTNDDGIDAPGMEVLYERLSRLGSVRVVAPHRDQSGSGRSLTINRARERGAVDVAVDREAGEFSYEVPHEPHELGYALDATPCDCVILGVHAFETPDLVVSGPNAGLNLGGHVMTRSGTVSAAIEAAIADVPAIAVSMEHREPAEPDAFATAAAVTADLADHALGGDVFDMADYLNVNVPTPGTNIAGAELTRPAETYPLEGAGDGDRFEIRAELLDRSAGAVDAEVPGTDRHAVVRGRVSVSPLAVPRSPTAVPALEEFVDGFDTPEERVVSQPAPGE